MNKINIGNAQEEILTALKRDNHFIPSIYQKKWKDMLCGVFSKRPIFQVRYCSKTDDIEFKNSIKVLSIDGCVLIPVKVTVSVVMLLNGKIPIPESFRQSIEWLAGQPTSPTELLDKVTDYIFGALEPRGLSVSLTWETIDSDSITVQCNRGIFSISNVLNELKV